MLDVSISIVNYNAKDLLDACIASIINTIKQHTYEIIVIDNASSDGSIEMVRARFPHVNLILNASNLGFIRANNLGIKSSKGRYVLSLNNDTVVKEGAIDSMIRHMDKYTDIGAIGPKLLNSDGSIQRQCRRSFPTPLNSFFYFTGLSRLFPKNERLGSYLLTYIDDSKAQDVDCLCGAAMLVRREVIDKVGRMDESYFMYGDDIDWCYRIKQAGWKVLYYPAAEIVHYGGMGGSRKQSYRNIYEFHRAMATFHAKHNAGHTFPLLNWTVYAGIWLKCLISLIRNVLRKDKYIGTKKP